MQKWNNEGIAPTDLVPHRCPFLSPPFFSPSFPPFPSPFLPSHLCLARPDGYESACCGSGRRIQSIVLTPLSPLLEDPDAPDNSSDEQASTWRRWVERSRNGPLLSPKASPRPLAWLRPWASPAAVAPTPVRHARWRPSPRFRSIVWIRRFIALFSYSPSDAEGPASRESAPESQGCPLCRPGRHGC